MLTIEQKKCVGFLTDCLMSFHARMKRLFILAAALLCPLLAGAQLAVTISSPKIVGQKAVVKLTMKNNLSEQIEFARAAVFLSDAQGLMIGTATKWVIGGTKNRPPLESKAEATFNFVVTSPQPFASTNITATVTFDQMSLAGGQMADIKKDIQIQNVNQ